MGKLDGRVALITGAGRGFGKAMALAFAREGELHPSERMRGCIEIGRDRCVDRASITD